MPRHQPLQQHPRPNGLGHSAVLQRVTPFYKRVLFCKTPPKGQELTNEAPEVLSERQQMSTAARLAFDTPVYSLFHLYRPLLQQHPRLNSLGHSAVLQRVTPSHAVSNYR